MPTVTKLRFLRLAAYDSVDECAPLTWIGPVWPDTPLAHQFFAHVMRRYAEQHTTNLGVSHCLGVFTWQGVLTEPPADERDPVVKIARQDEPNEVVWVRLSQRQLAARDQFVEEFNTAFAGSGLLASVN